MNGPKSTIKGKEGHSGCSINMQVWKRTTTLCTNGILNLLLFLRQNMKCVITTTEISKMFMYIWAVLLTNHSTELIFCYSAHFQ